MRQRPTAEPHTLHIHPATPKTKTLKNILTLPYHLILRLRHYLYDRHIRKSYRTPVPSIGIGNITVGGTGKTPHCEMLLAMLYGEYPIPGMPEMQTGTYTKAKAGQIAVISRGYGRKTKGLREVSADDDAASCGDEPLQIKRKFPQTRVIVCESRKKAIDYVADNANGQVPSLIIFDDIMQHRKIIPDKLVALMDYNRPIDKDSLLPFGRLRDIPYAMKRADILIVTKMPEEYIPEGEEDEIFRKKARVSSDCSVFYSSLRYGNPKPVFAGECEPRYAYSGSAICFSAIANDFLFKVQVSCSYKILDSLKFRDHHNFSRKNIASIAKLATKHPEAVIITTEKDMTRLLTAKLPAELKRRLFYIPVRAVLQKDEDLFRKVTGLC